ncbi:hypothetical protein ZWY2020_057810 [Hordeum vulgare]|nr:hypothetical protein ZWY2020_057810 [Hordeum vulgare]
MAPDPPSPPPFFVRVGPGHGLPPDGWSVLGLPGREVFLLVLVAAAFSRALAPRFPSPPAARRCRPGPEGSWSAGVFLEDFPFVLKPTEHWGASADAGAGAAWPVANPAVTCADVAEAGHPSSFVASPFLFLQMQTVNCHHQDQRVLGDERRRGGSVLALPGRVEERREQGPSAT